MKWWVMRRRLHVSWVIAVLAAGVCGGVVGAQYLPTGLFAAWVWLMVAMGLAVVCLWSRWIMTVPLVFCAGMLLGVWRGGVENTALLPYQRLDGSVVVISGSIADDPERDARGQTALRLSRIMIDGHGLPGMIRATIPSVSEAKRGDDVTLRGKVRAGFGGFAATMNDATLVRAQRPEPGDVARQVRDGFADKVRVAIDEPMVSLGLGYLLGQRRGLPEELQKALVAAGLTHVVVASGYNLTILVRVMRRIFVRVSKYLAAATSGALIVGFMAVTGLSPSMSRAGLVAGLSLAAWYYGRRVHPMVLLPFAAAVTLLINPSYGWGDVGWQLSFASFGGVMIVAPLAQGHFFGEQKPGMIRQIVGETMAAFVVTLPILMMTFGQFSAVALLANVLVLPLVPLAMLLVFATGILVMTAPPLGVLIGHVAAWLLQYMIWVAQTVAAWPWAQVNVQFSQVSAVVFYVGLALACGYAWRVTQLPLRTASVVE